MASPPRRPYVAGNWKMNKDLASAVATARAVAERCPAAVRAGRLDAGLFPPALFVEPVARAIAGSGVVCGAQDMHWETSGAFTGETSGPMILSVGATSVILGHSERRQFFGETDERVRKKAAAALAIGLRPIVCVGETLSEREAGATERVVLGQVSAALQGLEPKDLARLDVAYEPVWAIGTGRNATPRQAVEVHAAIREAILRAHGDAGRAVRILYGGSVNARNVSDLMASPEIDGALVGGASLEAESFLDLLARTEEAKRVA